MSTTPLPKTGRGSRAARDCLKYRVKRRLVKGTTVSRIGEILLRVSPPPPELDDSYNKANGEQQRDDRGRIVTLEHCGKADILNQFLRRCPSCRGNTTLGKQDVNAVFQGQGTSIRACASI